MSFLTLEPFLNAARRKANAAAGALPASSAVADGSGPSAEVDVLDSVLSSVGSVVLAGESLADLGRELDAVRDDLRANASASQLAATTERFDKLLRTFRERLRRADEERANDFRNVLSTLNEAFLHVSSGGERQDVRWKHLESSLHIAARADDLRTLKQQLSDLIVYVRKESQQEREKNQEVVESLGERVRTAHQTVARFPASLAAREEAIALLKEHAMRGNAESSKPYAAVFALDGVQALRNRHGNPAANGVIEEFGRQRVRGCVPDARIFRWSPEALIAIWQSTEDLPHMVSLVSGASGKPFEHRIFVGTRMASFSLPYRTVVTSVNGDASELIFNLDRFAKRV